MLSLVSSGTAAAARAKASTLRVGGTARARRASSVCCTRGRGRRRPAGTPPRRRAWRWGACSAAPRSTTHAPTSSLVQSPSPQRPSLARTTSARASAAASFVSRSCCAANCHRAVDVGEVRGLLVAEHRERHAGRRPGSHGEAGARGREVLPARAPVVQEDALRAILVELHGGGERALGQDVAARRANLAPEVELVPHVRLAARGAARGARRLAAHRGGRTEEGRARAILMASLGFLVAAKQLARSPQCPLSRRVRVCLLN